jgi:class 3 adenylate cyclase
MGLAEFRERHPWPAKYRALGRPREWLWSFDIPGKPEDLWPYLTDTARTNRATGLGEMHYSEQNGELHGWHRTAGLRHDFVERWQWIAPRRAELVREYSTGLAHLLRQLLVLEPRGDGSRFYVYTAWIPRGMLGPVAVRIGMRFFEAKYRTVVGRMVDAFRRAASVRDVTRIDPPRLDDERRGRLATLRETLRKRGVDADALDRLIALAESGDELELDRIRVRQLARDWRIDERRLLIAALHATRGGLLELTWDIMCPHCRGVRNKLKSLGDIPERERCDACSIEFGTDRENAIEVTFRIHPSIRPLEGAVYCSAQPVKRAHIRLSQEVAPGETRPVETSLTPGRYRARRRGEETVAPLVVREDGPSGEVVHWSAAGAPDRASVGPAPTFDLVAGEGAPTTFVVEEIDWDAGALQPADLFNLQEFRDLFNEQYLAAGVQLHIGEQTVLFTDIVGSTKFYADVGDPTAFVEVKKHFAEVYASVAAQGGGVVKTIGDAVMAAFSDPIAAVRTASEVHHKFPGNPGLRLRVSINTGPCIAVNLNSGIDYFGGTVNTAAKLQRVADAGEVALSSTTLAAPGVRDALSHLGGALRATQLDHDALGLLQVTVWRPPTA